MVNQLVMSYAVLGGVAGGLGSFVISKVCNVDFSSRGGYPNFPSSGDILVAGSTVAGLCIGLGMDIALLRTGKHAHFNKARKMYTMYKPKP